VSSGPHAARFTQQPGVYLLNHSVGLPPINAAEYAEQNFFETWREQAEPWRGWIDAITTFKTALAELFAAHPNEFCPQTNLSSALTKILSAMPKRSGRNKIVLTEQDFPSMGFVVQQAGQDYELVFIPRDADLLDMNVWNEYLSRDVACALITHAYSNTGVQPPVTEITARTRELEIISIIDVAQSAGVVPIDLDQWRADVVLGSCVKWLCGGPGAGYLWLSPEASDHFQPTDVGWFSHADPFEFDIHNFRYAEDASRFWGGTPSILPYVVATNGIALINEIGVANIRQHNIALTEQIANSIDDTALKTPRTPTQRGGTLVLHFGDNQEKLIAKLNEAEVRFDSRAFGIRLSPHIYNSSAEIDTVVSVLTA